MRYNPPEALSARGWRLFDKEFKECAPIRHWIMNDFRKEIINPIYWKYRAVKEWILYRTIHKYHIVDSGLKPGYYEIDTLILHVNFNMLKDFVEVEQAIHDYHWTQEYREKATWCERHMPFYRIFYPFRRPDLGIKHLEWASSLDDPKLPPHEQCIDQAVNAREILVLYKWWVEDRPNRKEAEHIPFDSQGKGLLGFLDSDFDHEAEDYKKYTKSVESSYEQEEKWHIEDQEMLIRLMKIRRSLWT